MVSFFDLLSKKTDNSRKEIGDFSFIFVKFEHKCFCPFTGPNLNNVMKTDQNNDVLAVIHSLPTTVQDEIYDFVEFLVKKQEKLTTTRKEPQYQVTFGNPNGLLIKGETSENLLAD